jgi:hypothetical protein
MKITRGKEIEKNRNTETADCLPIKMVANISSQMCAYECLKNIFIFFHSVLLFKNIHTRLTAAQWNETMITHTRTTIAFTFTHTNAQFYHVCVSECESLQWRQGCVHAFPRPYKRSAAATPVTFGRSLFITPPRVIVLLLY